MNLKSKYREFVRDHYQRQEICPWWKGYVYYDYCRDLNVVAPLGFNILFYFAYGLWLRIRIIRLDARKFAAEQLRLREQPTKQQEE